MSYILSHEVIGYVKRAMVKPFVKWSENSLRESLHKFKFA